MAKINDLIIEALYETDEGLEFVIDPNNFNFIKEQSDLNKLRLGFILHVVDRACIYALFNKEKWTNSFDLYTYCQLKRNTKEELYNLLIKGEFDIGVSYCGSYHLITSITPYDHDDNSEIRMHYEYPKSTPGNIAHYSITSDTFKEQVDTLNNYKRSLL